MPSSYSASARYTLQAPGEGTNTWGTILNTGVFQLVDTNVNGMLSFALSGTKTLTTANGATDEARNAMLNVTGGAGGTITIPSVTKAYVVRNASTGNVVVTTGSGRAVTVAPPAAGGVSYAVVLCDATNVDRHPNQTEIDAALTAAKAYADSLQTSAGNLPGVAGNAGRYLTNDGSSAMWQATGAAAGTLPDAGAVVFKANNGSDFASPSTTLKNLGGASYASLSGLLSGLNTSAPGGASVVTVQAGRATDSTTVDTLILGSAYTKTVASAWSVGSGNGLLDTGTVAASTWYYLYLIKRSDTGVVDAIASLSATAPALPANYTLFRRIGSFRTDGSSFITGYSQKGDEFLWLTPLQDFSVSASLTNFNVAMRLPPAIQVQAIAGVQGYGGAATPSLLVYSPDLPAQGAGGFNSTCSWTAGQTLGNAVGYARTSNGSLNFAVSSVAGSPTISAGILGWNDRRGRDG